MRGLYPIKARGPARALVAGSFITVGSGNPSSLRGQGFTVTREAQGRYTVDYDDPVVAWDSVVVTVAPETVATELVAIVDEDTIDTDSFEIRVSDLSGNLQDDAGSRVSFIAVARLGNHNA